MLIEILAKVIDPVLQIPKSICRVFEILVSRIIPELVFERVVEIIDLRIQASNKIANLAVTSLSRG